MSLMDSLDAARESLAEFKRKRRYKKANQQRAEAAQLGRSLGRHPAGHGHRNTGSCRVIQHGGKGDGGGVFPVRRRIEQVVRKRVLPVKREGRAGAACRYS